jgi:molybdopterin converting factor small subunit
LPAININFIGPWRVLLGERTVTVKAENIGEARDYVETNFGPVFEKKTFKDGDKLDLLPKVAGG